MKLKPVDIESSSIDKLHFALSAIAVAFSGILLLTVISGPAVGASLYLAYDEHGSDEPPRQSLLLLSPALFAFLIALTGIVFYVPGPPYTTTANTDLIKGLPFGVFYLSSIWLLILPWRLARKKWRGFLLVGLWIPTLYIIAVVATMSVTGTWL